MSFRIKLQQRMYKFKFDPPQEHRRSLHQPKHEHIAIFNTLDKCTQILREDRLWLRGEIKNNNNDVLNIFKQHPRSTQLQQMQVKLRKYVQNVKNRMKQEQLAKFRETLQSGHPHEVLEKQRLPKRTVQSNSRSRLKSIPSSELHKTSQFRPNRSIEQPAQVRNKTLSMNNTQSYKQFQELVKYKYNHDVIEERESENVTSARLHRQENQRKERVSQPLKELNCNNLGLNFWQKKLENVDNKVDYGVKTSSIPTFPSQYSQNKNSQTWDFEKKAKQALYEFQVQNSQQNPTSKDNHQQSQLEEQGYSRIDRTFEDREDSIFDKHFCESQKISSHNEHHEISHVNEFKQTQQEMSSPHFQLKEVNFSSISTNKVGQREKENESVEENLFTPQELLNQCRNFLKNRESSVKKEVPSQPFQQFLERKINQQVVESPECIFTRNHQQEESPSHSEKIDKKEEQSYTFPQIRNSGEPSLESTLKKEQPFSYQHFETFANSSSHQKPSFEKAVSPPQLVSLPLPIPMSSELQSETLPASFGMEDFLEQLMEQTEMNPFVSVEQLTTFLQDRPEQTALSHILREQLQMDHECQICLTTLAEKINQAYNEHHEDSYPHNDNTINSVYDLLDIDQKGYIIREDIDSFLAQIAEAEVQNYSQVSSELVRLFEGADFTNEHRLTYWHFFLVRSSDEFETVSLLLGEFEFEIERQA